MPIPLIGARVLCGNAYRPPRRYGSSALEPVPVAAVRTYVCGMNWRCGARVMPSERRERDFPATAPGAAGADGNGVRKPAGSEIVAWLDGRRARWV